MMRVALKSTGELLRLRQLPLAPLDRAAVEKEIAARAPQSGSESKDQMQLFGEPPPQAGK